MDVKLNKKVMKKALVVLLMLMPIVGFSQQKRDENMTLYWSINSYRHKAGSPTLFYNFKAQPDCDERLKQIQKDFSIPEEGFEGICDGEIIFKNKTYVGLLGLVTDHTDLYEDRDIRQICVATAKVDTMYYAVVRIWERK
jgi:hypothetical protein